MIRLRRHAAALVPAAELSPKRIFVLRNDDEYGSELVAKVNQSFVGTKAIITSEYPGELENMHMLKRLAITTTIAWDPYLKSTNIWPISPLQSEVLLSRGQIDPTKYSEDLGLVLFDTINFDEEELYDRLEVEDYNGHGYWANLDEGAAIVNSMRYSDASIKDMLKLRKPLLFVNAGLYRDENMPLGLRPIILPDVTQVYSPEILSFNLKDYHFDLGLDNGLPSPLRIWQGKRRIILHSNHTPAGLRVLWRTKEGNLDALDWNLTYKGLDSRITMGEF